MKKGVKGISKNLQALTVQEVSTLLKITRHTLYELINSGELEGFKCGKSYRITEEALENFITKNKIA